MITEYVATAMKRAQYEILEDGSYYGNIPGFPGVWANEETLEVCREELQSALEDWLLVKLWDGDDDIPVLGKLSLLPRKKRGQASGTGLKKRASTAP